MLNCENLITTLDKFSTAVYLKDLNGRHISMNKTGINMMRGSYGNVLGKTTYELFDRESAQKMTQNDQSVMKSGQLHMSSFEALDRFTGDTLHLLNAKTAVLSPTGKPLGVVGISLVNCKDLPLYADVCRLLPRFVKTKQPRLLNELLELQSVADFFKSFRLVH